MKRLCSIFLVLLMAFGLVPKVSSPVHAADSFRLSLYVEVLEDDGVYQNQVWKSDTVYHDIDADCGHTGLSQYDVHVGDTITVTAEPKDGYRLFVISYGEVMIYKKGLQNNSYTFTVGTNSSGNPIDYVQVRYLKEELIPEVGFTINLPDLGPTGLPATESTPASYEINTGTGFTVDKACWYEEYGISGMPEFVAGEKYFVEIEITPEDGYDFSDNLNVVLNNATVRRLIWNGDSVTIVTDNIVMGEEQYYLWVGSTRVTESNKDDILGDGKVSFDTSTHTLNLNNPAITDFCEEDGNNKYQILAKNMDLMMTGSATFDDRYGSVAVIGGMLSMSGNFTASGPYQAYYAEDGFHIFGGTVSVGSTGGVGFATPSAFFISAGTVYANGYHIGIHAGTVMIGGGRLNAAGEVGAGIYVDGGALQAYGGTLYTWGLECGVHLVDADLQFGSNLRRATIHGENQSAIKTEERCSLSIDSSLAVKEPVDKVISSDNILDPSGAPVNRVVIEPETLSATFRPGEGEGERVVYSDLEIDSTFTVPNFFDSWTAPGTTHFNGWTYKDPETEAGWYSIGAIKLGKEHTFLGMTTFTADYANWITGWEDDSGLEDVLFEVECNAAILGQTAEFPVKAGENAGIMFSFDDPDLYYVDEVFVLNQSGQVIDSFSLQRVGDYYDGGFTMPEEDVSLKFTVKQVGKNTATFLPGEGAGEPVVYPNLEDGSTITIPDFFDSWTAPGTEHFNGWTYKDPETNDGWYPIGAIKLGQEHTLLGTTTFTADYANWITGWEDDSGLEDVLFEVECNAAILGETEEFPVKAGETANILFNFENPDLNYVEEVFVLNQNGQVIESFPVEREGDWYAGSFTMPEEDVSMKFTVKQLEGNPPEITKHPKSVIVSTIALPQSIEFSIEATGSNLQYQWQGYIGDDQNPEWVDLRQDNNITGVRTNTLRMNARMIDEPAEIILRCVVTNTFGTVNSNEVKLIAVAETGWNKTSLGWVFIQEDGTYPINKWQQTGGKWYHFDAQGIMQTGWIKLSGKWYYLSGNGAMVTGWQTIGGKKYYFESSGAMVTGWKKIDGKYYYFAGGGAMMTGWQTINGKTYYLGTDGVMRTGWQKINNKWFYFAGSGAVIIGWKQIDSKWYYFDTNGVMQVGWKTINGSTYYFKSSGVMAANEWCKGYWLNANGTWTYKYKASWKQNSKGWYYQDTSGWYAKLTTLTIDDKQYSFDTKGYLVQ